MRRVGRTFQASPRPLRTRSERGRAWTASFALFASAAWTAACGEDAIGRPVFLDGGARTDARVDGSLGADASDSMRDAAASLDARAGDATTPRDAAPVRDATTPPRDAPTSGDDGARPPSDGVGAACTTDTECGGVPDGGTCSTMLGTDIFEMTFPGGYCTKECTPPGPFGGGTPDECGPGAVCTGFRIGDFGVAYCARRCATATECRDGYMCTTPLLSSDRLCLPPSAGFGDGGLPFGDGGFFPDFEGGIPGFDAGVAEPADSGS